MIEVDEKFEVIIVGAGVVGCALGHALAKAGRKVLVVERDVNMPDRIVGELMQPGGVQKLRELGLEGCVKNIDAADVVGYSIFWQGKGIRLPYPQDKAGNVILGSSFHHGNFIMALRNALERSKAELRQGTVKSLIEDADGVRGVVYTDASGNTREVLAPLTVVCDGAFSNLRKNFNNEKPIATSCFVGVVIKDTELPFPKHGHVFLTANGPILAYQIGTHETRMLVDIPMPLPSASNGDLQKFMTDVTAPQLPESIRQAFLTAVQSSRPRSMPNSRLHPQPNGLRRGVLLLGDAFNMRHPLTGGGMSVALSDVVIIRDILAKVGNLSNTARTTKALESFYVQRKPLAATTNILAGALYNVFTAANDPVLPAMRQACLSYFRMGGFGVSGPVALLSVLKPSPIKLVLHFFAVAILGVMQVLWPFPTPSRIAKAYRLLSAAATIVVPLIKAEGVVPYVPFICRILRLTKPTTPVLTPTDQLVES